MNEKEYKIVTTILNFALLIMSLASVYILTKFTALHIVYFPEEIPYIINKKRLQIEVLYTMMVPGAGLEPAWSKLRQILSLLRLPFRHLGAQMIISYVKSFVKQFLIRYIPLYLVITPFTQDFYKVYI